MRALFFQLINQEFQLISSYCDLLGNEKSTLRGIFPFSFQRKKEKRNSETCTFLFPFCGEKKNGIQKRAFLSRSVYCWSILICTYTQHKKTTHNPVYHALCTSEWQPNAENTLVYSSLTFITTLAMKPFSYSLFPVTLAVRNWKIDLFSVCHASRMVIHGSLLKPHPKFTRHNTV